MKRKRPMSSGESLATSSDGEESESEEEVGEEELGEGASSGDGGTAAQGSDDESGSSDGGSEDDPSDDHCLACGTAAGNLLCCEACPNVFHLHCLVPPLEAVPRGAWHCPACRQVDDLQLVERILSSRQASTSDEGEGAEAFLVKWKGRSHLHCAWVPAARMARAAKQHPASVGQKLRMFREARRTAPPPEEGEAEAPPIDPAWTTVGRLLAARPAGAGPGLGKRKRGGGAGPEFLVKWEGLPYEAATWEACALLAGPAFERELARLRARQPIAAAAPARKEAAAAAGGVPKRFAETPAFVRGQLHGYQLEGLSWLCHSHRQGHHVILADEMGLGKTVQTIAYLAALTEAGAERPHLVVVPLSTLPNWERELAQWAPQLNAVAFHGTQAGRRLIREHELFAPKPPGGSASADLQARALFHVMLTSYETALAEDAALARLGYEALVVDEGHRLKNKDSRLFGALKRLRARHRVLLTGTPLQNNLTELFMLLHFLDPGKFEGLETQFQDVDSGDQVARLHALLKPHMLRRLKADVLRTLPPKRELVLRVELTPLQKRLYRGTLTRSLPALTAAGGKAVAGKTNVLMELRKCCLHPYLLSREVEEDALRELAGGARPSREQVLDLLVGASGKLALLDRMLARLRAAGHRALVYSQFTTMLDVLEDWLRARRWGHVRLDGNVGSQERQVRIDAFNSKPDEYCCFLLSTRAGGQGINLASADTVVIFDSDWNPHNDLQAQARAHRLGQTRAVVIYRLVTRGSVEERMMQLAKRKLHLERVVVSHMARPPPADRQAELDDLLRYGARELFEEAAAEDAAKQEATPATGADGQPGGEGAAEQPGEAKDAAAAAPGKVVYDEAALDRLLDREQLLQQAREADGPVEDEFMDAFKVASFEEEEEEEAEAPPAAEPPPAPANPGETGAFWDGLLRPGFEQGREAELDALGKGRRQRRNVNYDDRAAYGELAGGDSSGESDDDGDDSEVPDEEEEDSDDDFELEAVGGEEVADGGLAARRARERLQAALAAPASAPAPAQLPAPAPAHAPPAHAPPPGYWAPAPGYWAGPAYAYAYAPPPGYVAAPMPAHGLGGVGGFSQFLQSAPLAHLAVVSSGGGLAQLAQQTAASRAPPAGSSGSAAVQTGSAPAPAAAPAGSGGGRPASQPASASAQAAAPAVKLEPPDPERDQPAASPRTPPPDGGGSSPAVRAASAGQREPPAEAAASGGGSLVVRPASAAVPAPAPASRDTGELAGFTAAERRAFLQNLLTYGLFAESGGQDGLSAERLARLQPRKSLAEVQAYAQLFLVRLQLPPEEAGTPAAREAQQMLCGTDAATVLLRLGYLSVIRQNVRLFRSRPAACNILTPAATKLPDTRPWRPEHDFAVLHGILAHGFGGWAGIAADRRLGLKAAVLAVCGIPTRPDDPSEPASTPAAVQQWRERADIFVEQRAEKLLNACILAAQVALPPVKVAEAAHPASPPSPRPRRAGRQTPARQAKVRQAQAAAPPAPAPATSAGQRQARPQPRKPGAQAPAEQPAAAARQPPAPTAQPRPAPAPASAGQPTASPLSDLMAAVCTLLLAQQRPQPAAPAAQPAVTVLPAPRQPQPQLARMDVRASTQPRQHPQPAAAPPGQQRPAAAVPPVPATRRHPQPSAPRPAQQQRPRPAAATMPPIPASPQPSPAARPPAAQRRPAPVSMPPIPASRRHPPLPQVVQKAPVSLVAASQPHIVLASSPAQSAPQVRLVPAAGQRLQAARPAPSLPQRAPPAGQQQPQMPQHQLQQMRELQQQQERQRQQLLLQQHQQRQQLQQQLSQERMASLQRARQQQQQHWQPQPHGQPAAGARPAQGQPQSSPAADSPAASALTSQMAAARRSQQQQQQPP